MRLAHGDNFARGLRRLPRDLLNAAKHEDQPTFPIAAVTNSLEAFVVFLPILFKVMRPVESTGLLSAPRERRRTKSALIY
jgi:hypothetical protein